MVVALIVNMYSSWRYLRNKKHEPTKYQRYFDHTDEDDIDIIAAEAGIGIRPEEIPMVKHEV